MFQEAPASSVFKIVPEPVAYPVFSSVKQTEVKLYPGIHVQNRPILNFIPLIPVRQQPHMLAIAGFIFDLRFHV